jgi:hypothetical protein
VGGVDGEDGGGLDGAVGAELAGAVVGAVVCCAGVEDCRWLGVDVADWAGVV